VKCTVKVAEWVSDRLKRMPRVARMQVYQRLLVDLPSNPDQYLRSLVVPFATKYSLLVTAEDPSQYPYKWLLVFVVDRVTPDELHVVSVRDDDDLEDN
jgi:hypothetical protein